MAETEITKLRDFPSVEELLQSSQIQAAVGFLPHPVVAMLVKEAVAGCKRQVKEKTGVVTLEKLFGEINTRLAHAGREEIRRVINAAGIVVHTNLGRAPLSEELFDTIKDKVVGYSSIEFDLRRGVRGKRGVACEHYLATLSGAESATVVNNCAAALFVILNSLANRRKVVISRGELVQIGGGFRIPDILKRSGARLAEIGATNVTTAADYENAIDDKTAMILKVHKSNFVQAGFTEEVPLKQLVSIGKKLKLPVVNDLGSGVFVQTREMLGYNEPTVQQSVRAGADLTCFSGDKMLGGVQAGLIVGRADFIVKIKKNPLFRTVRVDKVVLSIVERLLAVYLDGNYKSEIKLWSVLSTPISTLKKRGATILKSLGNPSGISMESTKAFVGGGALPESEIPSIGLVFSKDFKAENLAGQFRMYDPPVVGRIENERYVLDLKAIDPGDIDTLTDAVRHVIA